MLPPQNLIVRSGTCEKCNSEIHAQLYRQIFTDNSEHFLYICPKCQFKTPFGTQMWIPNEAVKTRLSPEQIIRLPTIIPEGAVACKRCGAIGAQNHHWGPRAIFPDAECWPQDPLCLKFHRIWHDTIEAFYKTKYST